MFIAPETKDNVLFNIYTEQFPTTMKEHLIF